jgi:hypothetical protein
MSAGLTDSGAQTQNRALLGRLYGRNKMLSLSIGATLAFGQQPVGARQDVDEHLADCERALSQCDGELAAQFEACRDAAAALVDLVAEVEPGPGLPSKQRLSAVRASHRRLRRLVWEVFECEYVPCCATGGHSHD